MSYFFKNIDWNSISSTLLKKLLYVIVVTILFYILYQISRKIINKLFANYSKKKWSNTAWALTLSRLSQSALQYTTVFLYIYTILNICGLPMSSILAGAGLLGVAITFAGRDLLSDITTGFFIILENQANVGEYISIINLPTVTGQVVSVGIRSMVIKDVDTNAETFISNHNIQGIKNYSRDGFMLFLELPLLPEVDIEATVKNVQDINEKVYNDNQNIFTSKPIYVGIVNDNGVLVLRTKIFMKFQDQAVAQNLFFDSYIDRGYTSLEISKGS